MNMMEARLVDQAVNAALVLLSLAFFLTFFRLVRGPSLPDRVVAVELLTALAVGFIAAYDITTNQPVFLDAATVLALISFLGTVAFARFVERGGPPWQR